MGRKSTITVSAPGKVHLLGEHSVVYGKPAILTSVNLRVYVTISNAPLSVIPTWAPTGKWGRIQLTTKIQKVIEPIVKKYLHLKKLPSYNLDIRSEAPIGSGLGSSAAISAAYIAALLSFLKSKWDLDLINEFTHEAEKVFHGNPSGGDPATVIYGGLIWFRKETADLKLIQPLTFKIPSKLVKNFILIYTGRPNETTRDMVLKVKRLYDRKPSLVRRFLDNQEILVRQLLPVIKEANEKKLKSVSSQASLIRILREGEKNLESIGVCSPSVKKIIRQIEKMGGAAKICGAGATSEPTGIVLAFHPDKNKLIKVVKSLNLSYFTVRLGVEGLRKD